MADPHADGGASARRRSPSLLERARRTLGHLLDRAEDELTHTRARVVALSPAATLQRGYAVLQRADGTVVRAARRRPPRARSCGRGSPEGEFNVTVGPHA